MNVCCAAYAMGTRFEVVLCGEDEARLRAVGEEALAEVEDWDRRLSLFRRESLLAHINAHAHERPVEVDEETFGLLAVCRDVWEGSGGAFDVTVAPLMRACGFRGGHGAGAVRERVEAAAAVVGFDGVELEDERRTVRFRRLGMALDMGAIGKGHGLDAAARVVREHGVACALLQGGTSSVVGIGAPLGERGWRVALGAGEDAPVAVLRDAALSVSAPHGRVVELEGEELGHVLDPRKKAPARGARLAATVIGGDGGARLADAWSTALLVLGERPAGMPAEMTSVLDTGPMDRPAWSISGPHAEEAIELPSSPPRVISRSDPRSSALTRG